MRDLYKPHDQCIIMYYMFFFKQIIQINHDLDYFTKYIP
jgi:hypothetical protein